MLPWQHLWRAVSYLLNNTWISNQNSFYFVEFSLPFKANKEKDVWFVLFRYKDSYLLSFFSLDFACCHGGISREIACGMSINHYWLVELYANFEFHQSFHSKEVAKQNSLCPYCRHISLFPIISIFIRNDNAKESNQCLRAYWSSGSNSIVELHSYVYYIQV